MNNLLKEILIAVSREINKNYQSVNHLSKELGYKSSSFLSKKVLQERHGINIKGTIYLSPEEVMEIKKLVLPKKLGSEKK